MCGRSRSKPEVPLVHFGVENQSNKRFPRASVLQSGALLDSWGSRSCQAAESLLKPIRAIPAQPLTALSEAGEDSDQFSNSLCKVVWAHLPASPPPPPSTKEKTQFTKEVTSRCIVLPLCLAAYKSRSPPGSEFSLVQVKRPQLGIQNSTPPPPRSPPPFRSIPHT